MAQGSTGRNGAGVEIDGKLSMWSGREDIESSVDEVFITPPSNEGYSVTGVFVLRDGVEVSYHQYQIDESSTPIEIHFSPPLEPGEVLIVNGSSTSAQGGGTANIGI